MTDDAEAIRRIAENVEQVPHMAELHAWASEYVDVETVVSDALYIAAYDYAGKGTFVGWWGKKIRGKLGQLLHRHKNRGKLPNDVCFCL